MYPVRITTAAAVQHVNNPPFLPIDSLFCSDSSGISAAKVLVENGIEDLVILEASDRIGGRIRKENFGGVSVELGAGWIAGVGGQESNPVWELAAQSGLRTCFSDYSNARYNIYDRRSSKHISTFLFSVYWLFSIFLSPEVNVSSRIPQRRNLALSRRLSLS